MTFLEKEKELNGKEGKEGKRRRRKEEKRECVCESKRAREERGYGIEEISLASQRDGSHREIFQTIELV